MTRILDVNTDQMAALVRQLKAAQPSTLRAVNKGVAQAAEVVAEAARKNASWSKKIPPTIRTSASGASATITAGNAQVPIAKWFENGRTDLSPVWKHPVFPGKVRSRWNWVAQRDPHRPFLSPALEDNQAAVTKAITEQVVSTLRAAIGGQT